ncbi:MAG: hypothetical protein F6J92_21610 [Symploca sp. SIO1A3]|nr:hypothetical protein [Symploca sp. SIO1A3]
MVNSRFNIESSQINSNSELRAFEVNGRKSPGAPIDSVRMIYVGEIGTGSAKRVLETNESQAYKISLRASPPSADFYVEITQGNKLKAYRSTKLEDEHGAEIDGYSTICQVFSGGGYVEPFFLPPSCQMWIRSVNKIFEAMIVCTPCYCEGLEEV